MCCLEAAAHVAGATAHHVIELPFGARTKLNSTLLEGLVAIKLSRKWQIFL